VVEVRVFGISSVEHVATSTRMLDSQLSTGTILLVK
jgi:hypothetical protein